MSAEFLFEETGDQRSAARAETQVVNDTDGPTPGGASAAKLGSPERQASRHPRAGAHGRQVSTEGAQLVPLGPRTEAVPIGAQASRMTNTPSCLPISPADLSGHQAPVIPQTQSRQPRPGRTFSGTCFLHPARSFGLILGVTGEEKPSPSFSRDRGRPAGTSPHPQTSAHGWAPPAALPPAVTIVPVPAGYSLSHTNRLR